MLNDLCTTFGCGARLTSIEKLCGSTCAKHTGEGAVVGASGKGVMVVRWSFKKIYKYKIKTKKVFAQRPF